MGVIARSRHLLRAAAPRARRVRAEREAWARRLTGRIDTVTLHARIAAAIREGRPFAHGRPGGYEARVVIHSIVGVRPYPEQLRRAVHDNAGVVHRTDAELDAFAATYLGALAGCDTIGVGDKAILGLGDVLDRVVRPGVELAGQSEADPRDALDLGAEPFTAALEGRRVLVVHPFTGTIERQYARRNEITGVRDLLPAFALTTLAPPVTFAGAPAGRSWHDGLAATTAAMAAIDFDVAIVGAGAYGLPLAAFARSLGRVGVHLAGATQLLFGIRGRRWESVPRVAREMDDTWVSPDPSERPPDPGRVEGGAYW